MNTPSPLLHDRVLVVEDNMLIAMETEYQLQALGAQQVDMAADVRSALALIAQHHYEFAVLDVNLGIETSEPVSEALKTQATRYVYATGYGEVTWQDGDDHPALVLAKPVSLAGLEQAILQTRA